MAAHEDPLSEVELGRLEDLLGSDIFHGEAMALDELQGFLCAILSGPELVPPSQWLPAALGESPHYRNSEQTQEILGLVMRFYNQIARALSAGETPDFVLYRPDEAAEYDYETWCRAYLEGVDFSPVAWEEAGDAGEIEELLFPIVTLAGELSAQTRRRLRRDELLQLLESCREELAGVVQDIHRYWLALRARPAALASSDAKVGRNDPCPCGSGKKFKHCCGAPDRLH
ncbi:MAG: UPF0149 family protein [Betaproteobacteria bacterium]|nr:UPF0149 family protein [Betaproteobacteria bacterium]